MNEELKAAIRHDALDSVLRTYDGVGCTLSPEAVVTAAQIYADFMMGGVQDALQKQHLRKVAPAGHA